MGITMQFPKPKVKMEKKNNPIQEAHSRLPRNSLGAL